MAANSYFGFEGLEDEDVDYFADSKSASVPSVADPKVKLTRIQEKNVLAGLNDRFAAYIWRNQQRESENANLNKKLSKSEEETIRTVALIKENYDKELLGLRRVVAESAKERSRLDLENEQLRKDYQDVREKLATKTKDASNLRAAFTQLDARFQDVTAQNNKLRSEKDTLTSDNKELKEENAKLTEELDANRWQLDQESLARADLQTQLKSRTDELNFKNRCLEQEVVEIKTRKVQEIQEVDGRRQEEHQNKLQESILELRAEYEAILRSSKEDWENLHEQKCADLKAQLKRLMTSLQSRDSQIGTQISRIESLTRQVEELETTKSSLTDRIRMFERQMDDDRKNFASRIAQVEEDMNLIAGEKESLLQMYEDLVDIKISLDNELATYRKLMESGERS